MNTVPVNMKNIKVSECKYQQHEHIKKSVAHCKHRKTCMHACTHTHTHRHTVTLIHTVIKSYTLSHSHTHTILSHHTHTHTHARMYTHTHARLHTQQQQQHTPQKKPKKNKKNNIGKQLHHWPCSSKLDKLTQLTQGGVVLQHRPTTLHSTGQIQTAVSFLLQTVQQSWGQSPSYHTNTALQSESLSLSLLSIHVYRCVCSVARPSC